MKKMMYLLIPALLLSSCGGDTPTPVPPTPPGPEGTVVKYDLQPSIRKADSEKTEPYHLEFKYSDEFFKEDAKDFSRDLALISNGKSLMAITENVIKSFYDTIEFDDFESHFVTEKTENTVSYALAHKSIEDFNVVSLAVCGHDYGLEWANNALLGESGDHLGFSLRANEIYTALQTYIADYENVKLWISGYSRGGAISNVLSHYILSRDDFDIDPSDMFVYTFECPKGLAIDNAPKYENVFNIIYSGDFIPYLAPTEYGFARCGVDIDLFESSTKTDEVLYNLDSDNSIPAFKPYSMVDSTGLNTITIENENDGPQALINYIARDGEDGDDYIYFPNREAFVNKTQHTIQTVLSVAFTLPSDIKSELLNGIMSEILNLDTAQKLYDFLTPYLDRGGYEYDPEELLADCEVIHKLIMTDFGLMMIAYFNEDVKNGLMRMFMVHFPEVGYILLKSYVPN